MSPGKKQPVMALAMLAFSVATTQAALAQEVGSSVGAVFTATNAVRGNAILMYTRERGGKLSFVGQFATGGRGEGGINDPLQSSDSVVVTSDHAFLLAVNAGSSDISVFRILPYGLALASVTPSGGGNPVSLAVHGNLVYVVNTGGVVHTAGFALHSSGGLVPIPRTTKPLSALDTGASTAVFSPDGSKLIITERLTNLVDVFSVASDGALSNPTFNPSAGTEPFGATFSPDGALLVTEAQTGSTSSYAINPDDTLTTISSKASADGGATCWVATSGQYAWVSNSISSDIGAYRIGGNGTLQRIGIQATVATSTPTIFPNITPPTSYPLDLQVSDDGRFLFAFFSATGKIAGFTVGNDGSLTPAGDVSAVKPQSGAEGLAVY